MPTAFETHARRLRFQALGKACQERGIGTLLMGHHCDDSIETTIWRLSVGARGSGLAGIPELAAIPECHGIFGVSESGTPVQLPEELKGSSSRLQIRLDEKNRGIIHFSHASNPKTLDAHLKFYSKFPPLIANGGISLCRPLLAFPKTQLVATCEENNIPYVSDPTNLDPTLTVRNTIRSLRSSNSLPRAFNAPSILSLIQSSQKLLVRSSKLSNQLLRECQILDINLRSGTMVIEFPKNTLYKSSALAGLSGSKLRDIETLTLRRITELISPREKNWYPLSNFTSFASRVFPRNYDDVSHMHTFQQRDPFTVGAVFFNPLSVKSLLDPTSSETTDLNGRNIWFLSRQPMKTNSPLPIDVPIVQEPASTAHFEGEQPSDVFTPWTLWDDRYWFRFSIVPKPGSKPQIDNIPLFIRALQRSDLQRIRTDPGSLAGENAGRVLPKPDTVHFQATLLFRAMAPGARTRFTLPLLTLGQPGKPGDAGEMSDPKTADLLALPTLGQHLSGRKNPRELFSGTSKFDQVEIYYAGSWWTVKWEWMYKMIDIQALQIMAKSDEGEEKEETL